ncbi:MAG TPA: PilN domain-containing protein [Candidatus Angelobacter sp.]|nr:PilN domain-containing protein [Candidatus Angelobacter sp.]
MIRINLSSLAPPKTKRGKRAPVTVSTPGEGSSTMVLSLVFLLVLLVAMGTWTWMVNVQADRLQNDWTNVMRENQRLAEVKTQYEASKRKADMYERRVKVVDDLKEAQKGPVTMLNLVADTVNKTDAVWLETMTTDGRTLNFTGMALSADAVADLMANLRKTGQFKSVEIKETSQDAGVKEVQAFKFELICEIGFSSKVQRQG